LTGFACGHGRRAAADAGTAQPAVSAVHLNVINNNALALEIYAVGSGITYRMGTVSPGIAREFVFPRAMIGNGLLEIQARPSGGGEVIRSGQLLLSPGQIVDFTIGSNQVSSTATVRP
jgi:hypothetical protein